MKGTAFFGGFCGFILSIREIYTRFNKLYSITVFFVIDTDVTIQSFLIGILYIRMRNFKIIYTCTKSRYKVYFFFNKEVRICAIFESNITPNPPKNIPIFSIFITRCVESYLVSIKLKIQLFGLINYLFFAPLSLKSEVAESKHACYETAL